MKKIEFSESNSEQRRVLIARNVIDTSLLEAVQQELIADRDVMPLSPESLHKTIFQFGNSLELRAVVQDGSERDL